MYRSILLKISGEALEGDGGVFGLETVGRICREVKKVRDEGVRIGVVIGGGNVLRGGVLEKAGLDRVHADSMGMLATIINSIMFSLALRKEGVDAVVQSALPVPTIVEDITLDRTRRYLDEGKVVLFAGGTGSPYFTTDTAAALRACEIGAEVLLKATKVDGIYDRDPVLHDDARRFDALTYDDVLAHRYKVMDMAAVDLCRDNAIPILVFNLLREDELLRAVRGDDVGTLVKER